MDFSEINNAFKKARKENTKEYQNIIKILSDPNNKLVKRAKTLNSSFGFASTVLLIPAFMIWISKHCEKMTKQRIAEQQKQAQAQADMNLKYEAAILADKPTMAGFLNK